MHTWAQLAMWFVKEACFYVDLKLNLISSVTQRAVKGGSFFALKRSTGKICLILHSSGENYQYNDFPSVNPVQPWALREEGVVKEDTPEKCAPGWAVSNVLKGYYRARGMLILTCCGKTENRDEKNRKGKNEVTDLCRVRSGWWFQRQNTLWPRAQAWLRHVWLSGTDY